MAYALVGARGTAVQTAASTALTTWAWGASENRTANNLLIATVTVTGSATLPATPAGWSIAKQVAGTSCSATIYQKIAAGADAVPTINAITSGLIAGQLSEYSGGATSTPVDQTGSATGTTSPNTATAAGANAATGELIIMAAADRRSAARASNDTWTSNDGTVTLAGSNNGVSSTDHYSFGAIVGSTATTAQTSVLTLSITTSITGLANVNASFKLAGGPVTKLQTVAASTLTTISIVRQTGKNVSVSSTLGPAIIKRTSKFLSVSMTATGAALNKIVQIRALMVSVIPTASFVRQVGKIISVTEPAVVQIVRRVGKIVNLSESPVATVAKRIPILIAVVVTPVASIVTAGTKQVLQAVAGVANVVATILTVKIPGTFSWNPAPTGTEGRGVAASEPSPPMGSER